MHSWGFIRFLEFVSRLRAVHLHGAAAVGAFLACFAVVLNVGPFAKAPKREAVQANLVAYGPDVRDVFRRAVAERSIGQIPTVQRQAGTGARPDRAQPTVEATNLSERFKPLVEPARASDDAVARAVASPITPKDRDVELQTAKPVRQDGGAPDPAARSYATLVGVWAPDTAACSVRDFRDGMLPTVINAKGAWAGATFCVFKKKQETKTGWRVVAKCSSLNEHWTADIHLAVKNDRLTWTSKRGSQSYTRCAPGFLMAATQ